MRNDDATGVLPGCQKAEMNYAILALRSKSGFCGSSILDIQQIAVFIPRSTDIIVSSTPKDWKRCILRRDGGEIGYSVRDRVCATECHNYPLWMRRMGKGNVAA
jgi:hypothetical protein